MYHLGDWAKGSEREAKNNTVNNITYTDMLTKQTKKKKKQQHGFYEDFRACYSTPF